MKRTPMPPRKAPMKRSTKPLPRINLRKARRQADKYAAHLKSPYFRDIKRQVRERSGGICERMRYFRIGFDLLRYTRCPNKAAVYNHLTYARFGHENPEDISHDCKECEREYENARPYRAAKRLLMRRMEKGQ